MGERLGMEGLHSQGKAVMPQCSSQEGGEDSWDQREVGFPNQPGLSSVDLKGPACYTTWPRCQLGP